LIQSQGQIRERWTYEVLDLVLERRYQRHRVTSTPSSFVDGKLPSVTCVISGVLRSVHNLNAVALSTFAFDNQVAKWPPLFPIDLNLLVRIFRPRISGKAQYIAFRELRVTKNNFVIAVNVYFAFYVGGSRITDVEASACGEVMSAGNKQ
jgi:hypothetical protein